MKRFMCVMIRSQEYFLQFMMHGKKEEKKKECGIAIKGMLEQELFVSTFGGGRIFHKEQAVERLIRKHLGVTGLC